MKTHTHVFCAVLVHSSLVVGAYAAGLVAPGTTELNDNGSSSSPAEWYLNGDYSIGSKFYVGRATSTQDSNWNQLSIDNGYDFTASAALAIGVSSGGHKSDYNSITVDNDSILTSVGTITIGGTNAQNNYLSVLAGGEINVTGDIRLGGGNVSYNGGLNHLNVSGSDARVSITGMLNLDNYYTNRGKDNYVNVSDDGVVFIDSDKDGTGDLDLFYHSSWGRCYLELNGGMVAIYGNKTAAYAAGQNVLKCIKLWDENATIPGWKIVADLPPGSALQLSVEYVNDADKAAEMGLDSEFIGFTVLQSVPEPTTMVLLAAGGVLSLVRRKR